MKSDKYLRFILTVIAICLVWICVRDIAVGPARLFAGENGRAPSVWVDGGQLDVTVTQVDGTALYLAEPIEVEIANPEARRPQGEVQSQTDHKTVTR